MNDDELKKLFETSEANTRRHFDVVAERLDKKIDLVVETVALLDEKLERFRDDVNGRFDVVDTKFADTQALIKFS